jgi:hypothetical protein
MIELGEDLTITDEEVEVLRKIAYKIHKSARIAGWHNKPRELGTGIALIHSELSEALEAGRKDLMDDHLVHRKGLEVELADVFIRLCDEGQRQRCDIFKAAQEKHAYNQVRPDHKLENRAKEGGKQF